jgi:nicotinic acid mononucleotide adenylyltransferase
VANQRRKELLFGGSATDPIHSGHIQLLETVLPLADLVFWYPSGTNGWKTMTDGLHRQAMANLAIPQEWIYNPKPGWGKLFVDAGSTMQVEPPTAIRYLQLAELFSPKLYRIRFFTGSDVATPDPDGNWPINLWGRLDILQDMEIVLIPRQGVNKHGRPYVQPGEIVLPPNYTWVHNALLDDVQSSVIREQIQDGKPQWTTHLDTKVIDYIKLHGLYGYKG